MKTAMQELEYKLKDNLKWIVMNADYELMDKLFKEGFEKEKEQIIEARLDGFKISGEGWNGEYPFEGESCKEINTRIDNEGYYNQTYNQKKQTTMKNKLGTTEDMTEYHENGNIAYEFKTSSNGLIKELTCDKNGYTLIAKNSNGCSYEYTRDDEGNELAFKNSDPYYRIKDKDVRKEQYEAFIQSLEKKVKDLLLEAAKPLIQYLNNNYHPHCKIIVQCDSVEVLEGVEVSITKEFIKD